MGNGKGHLQDGWRASVRAYKEAKTSLKSCYRMVFMTIPWESPRLTPSILETELNCHWALPHKHGFLNCFMQIVSESKLGLVWG
jgi:hypothetical protein